MIVLIVAFKSMYERTYVCSTQQGHPLPPQTHTAGSHSLHYRDIPPLPLPLTQLVRTVYTTGTPPLKHTQLVCTVSGQSNTLGELQQNPSTIRLLSVQT